MKAHSSTVAAAEPSGPAAPGDAHKFEHATADAVASKRVKITCDATDAFSASYDEPNMSIMQAFGGDPLHACWLRGEWDLEKAVKENSDDLIRSIHQHPSERSAQWHDLTFRLGPRSFLVGDLGKVVGFASTQTEAEQLVTDFHRKYAKPAPPPGGSFNLIMRNGTEIESQSVALDADTVLGDTALALHYGVRAVEWHQHFTEMLKARSHGLTILEGTPGTGKTSYLRHLMGTLRDTHRFYFIPTSALDILSVPEFIGFWADERRIYSDRQFVVILEDSDAALMCREADNREQVSAILNLSDGMLANFLRLQIICTINCAAAEIDQALLRPGRLLSHHVFSRLDRTTASRLAESLGKKLGQGDDFSLAEVFAGDELKKTSRSRIGFANR